MLSSIPEEEYQPKLIALAYSCPLEREYLHCPLKEVRTRSFSDKLKWLNSLSLPTKKTIYNYHLLCYAKHKKTV